MFELIIKDHRNSSSSTPLPAVKLDTEKLNIFSLKYGTTEPYTIFSDSLRLEVCSWFTKNIKRSTLTTLRNFRLVGRCKLSRFSKYARSECSAE